LELALLGEPAVFLPLAEPLVPLQAQRSGLGGCGAADAGVGVELILDLISRRARHLVEPRGVGEERPDRLRRLRKMRFLAIAVDRRHARVSGGASAPSLSQIRQTLAMVSPAPAAGGVPRGLEPLAETFQTNINSL